MRTWKFRVLVLVLMPLGACVYVPPWFESDAINRVEEIEEGVTTKDQVLELLGEPTYRFEDEHTNVFRYRGSESYGHVVILSPGGVGDFTLHKRRWRIRLQFDENDIVDHFTINEDFRAPIYEHYVAHKTEIKRRAHEGDPDAMYQHAKNLERGRGMERIRWYCLAAQAGHARARYQLGRYHHHGDVVQKNALQKNALQAYVWYTLSLEAEDTVSDIDIKDVARQRKDVLRQRKEVERQREKLSRDMTSDQVAEAERLVALWTPNPAACELDEAHLDN